MRTTTLRNIKTKTKWMPQQLLRNFLTWKWYQEELMKSEEDSQKERGMWMTRK